MLECMGAIWWVSGGNVFTLSCLFVFDDGFIFPKMSDIFWLKVDSTGQIDSFIFIFILFYFFQSTKMKVS